MSQQGLFGYLDLASLAVESYRLSTNNEKTPTFFRRLGFIGMRRWVNIAHELSLRDIRPTIPCFVMPTADYPPSPCKSRSNSTGVITKKPQPSFEDWGLSELGAWRWPTLTWGDPTLPSAQLRFTAEFGKGSGGTTALLSPSKNLIRKANVVIVLFNLLFCNQCISKIRYASVYILTSSLTILGKHYKTLRVCMVKPHG